MLYSHDIKAALEIVADVVPRYSYRQPDAMTALRTGEGNCISTAYLGLLVVENLVINNASCIDTKFGFTPPTIGINGKINMGHAFGKLAVGDSQVTYFDQTLDGTRIGPEKHIAELNPETVLLPTDEGYWSYIGMFDELMSTPTPRYEREDVWATLLTAQFSNHT